MMEKSRGKQHIACPGVSGGAEGSRTPVRKHFDRTFSGRSPVSTFPPCADTGQTAQFSRVIVHGRGNSYPPHVRHINDAFPGLWPLRFRRLPLVRQRQQYDCCQLIFKLPVLWRSGAAARLSSLHTPVETGAAPYWGFFGYCSNTRGKSVQPHKGFSRCAILGNSVVREGLAHCAILGNSTAHKVFARCAHTTHGNIYICVGEGDPPPHRKLISRRDRPASPAPDTSRPGCPR